MTKILLLSWVLAVLPALGGIQITGDYKISMDGTSFMVPALQKLSVREEVHRTLPVFQPEKVWYASGTGPRQTIFHALQSVRVRDADGKNLAEGKEFVFSATKNRVGLVPGAKVKEPVSISYEYLPQRLDSIVRTTDGKLEYRIGKSVGLMPQMPELTAGEKRLVNIHLLPGMEKLSPANIYPISETEFPETTLPCADEFLPKTMAKLRSGEPLRILAWGTSVTHGYDELKNSDRWQEQFVRRLKERFPKANITLLTNGWGGRNTADFLAAPESDTCHHYPASVVGVKPDLIISEFFNDSGYNQEMFEQIYPRLLKDFRNAGAEWLVIIPHHGMNMKNIDGDDPRLYVKLLRQFVKENHIPYADVSLRYSRLYRQGIPYLTLMVNHYNHPDAKGMKIFADSLMALFPKL